MISVCVISKYHASIGIRYVSRTGKLLTLKCPYFIVLLYQHLCLCLMGTHTSSLASSFQGEFFCFCEAPQLNHSPAKPFYVINLLGVIRITPRCLTLSIISNQKLHISKLFCRSHLLFKSIMTTVVFYFSSVYFCVWMRWRAWKSKRWRFKHNAMVFPMDPFIMSQYQNKLIIFYMFLPHNQVFNDTFFVHFRYDFLVYHQIMQNF